MALLGVPKTVKCGAMWNGEFNVECAEDTDKLEARGTESLEPTANSEERTRPPQKQNRAARRFRGAANRRRILRNSEELGRYYFFVFLTM
jgi:hypothetical protein